MIQTVMSYAPENWHKPQADWSKLYEVPKTSDEYQQLKFEIETALTSNSLKGISKIERFQNIHDYGQVLLREQLLLVINKHTPLYRVST